MKARLVVVLFAVLAFTTFAAFADGPITVTTKGEQADKAAVAKGTGEDENIKSKAVSNDPKKEVKPPAHKAAEGAEKGTFCGIVVDNWTDLKIQIYVDGNYEGLVGPWGDLFTVTICGRTKLYARADFDDGSVETWGPRWFDAVDGG